MVENSYNYYKKYIKYKNKYLQYKHNLRGGVPNIHLQPQPPIHLQPQPQPQPQPPAPSHVVVILASHQNAIAELLTMMVDGYALSRKKFKNCACIEISKVLEGDGREEVHVRMVYEGELDPKDTSKVPLLYFTVDTFNSHNYKFKDEHVGKIGTNVRLLLVRHGNGEHNNKTGIKGGIVKLSNPDIYTDALLTPLGIDQAQKAYQQIIYTILGYKKKCNIILCSSRLRRAIQTAGIIGFRISHYLKNLGKYLPYLSNLSNLSNLPYLPELKIVIVPGVEEIVNDTGNTEHVFLSIRLNPENRSICECDFDDSRTKKCNNLLIFETDDTNNPIEKISFDESEKGSINIDITGTHNKIPVSFIHMHNHKETIFPLSRRFDTAFEVLKEIVSPQ